MGIDVDALRCPGCARLYQDMAEIVAAGGHVRSLGLALKAQCVCGARWSVNSAWRRTKVIEKVSRNVEQQK